MQFVIETPAGQTIYKPGKHSREDYKHAFKSLRARGAGAGNILLASLYGELYPELFHKYHRSYLKAHGW